MMKKQDSRKSQRVSILILMAILTVLTVCGCKNNESQVVIYTSSDENEISILRKMLDEKFPDYEISIEYLSTGEHAAKLKAEGTSTECDISYDLEYGYLGMLDQEGIFADLSSFDSSIFLDDMVASTNYIPTMRYGGAIIVNTDILAEKNLKEPTSYEDLLKSEYKDLISMPNPKASGTGYMFYYSLVKAKGEAEALAYFDALSRNILQFTSSGSGPVNSLVQGEVAIALGMTSHAAIQISRGYPLKILFFEEGSPYQACGAAVIKGKETSQAVMDVFQYLYDVVTPNICEQLYPEQIYRDNVFSIDHYPENIHYADMANNTPEEKERLLKLWPY